MRHRLLGGANTPAAVEPERWGVTGYTEPAWPASITAFEEFLKGAGLKCLRRETDLESGGKLLQYGSAIVGVRLIFDGRAWLVEMAGVGSRLDEWYDAAVLRDLLAGGQSADTLPLAQQIEFVGANWHAIVRAFDPIRRADAHMRLAFLRCERVKRQSAASNQTPESGAGSDVPEEREDRQHN
jgi:hypothetical protein